MSTYTISDSFFLNGVGFNGATVTAWKASRFSGVPAENSAPPSGSADAGPVTTAASFGNEGAFQIAVPTQEDYYISVVVSSNRYWKLYNAALFQDGATAGKVVTNNNTLDDGSGNMTVAGGLKVNGIGPASGSMQVQSIAGTAHDALIGNNGAWTTNDASGTTRNTLDDGSGNMTVATDLTVAGGVIAASTTSVLLRPNGLGSNHNQLTLGVTGNLFTSDNTGAARNTLDDGSGNLSAAGTVTGTALIPSGLTGSVAASRFVGATASGAPTTGAHNVGDFVVDQTGAQWICIAAGTPGTWISPSNTQGAVIGTSETTTSATYTDLTTHGPAVTLVIGTRAIVTVTAYISNNTTNDGAAMGFALSGANTVSANDNQALIFVPYTTGFTSVGLMSASLYLSGLTPGSTTFTAKYRTNGGTSSFANRNIIVQPLP